MVSFKTKPYPRAWEIGLSKVLNILLPPGQLVAIVYMVVLMCNSPIVWIQVGLLFAVVIATQMVYKNVKGILGVVKDDNDSSRE